MKSRSKIFSILLLVLLLSTCVTVFAACRGDVPDVPSVVKPTTKQVSLAMTEVYQAIVASNRAQGVTEFTLGFNGEYSGEKSFTYNFAANFNIGAANINEDTQSELSFVLSEETGSVLGIFYKEGYLYIDYPPLIEKGKFSGVELAPLVKSFYDANTPDGKIDTLADLIPTIGNYIFSDCIYSREDNVSLYNFTISFQSFFASVATIMQLADIGIGESELIEALNLAAADIYALQNGGTGNIKITTVSTGGVAVFNKAEFSSAYTVGEVNERSGLTVEDFVLQNGSSTIALPTNLDSAYGNYCFGNLDLTGSIVIDTVNSDTTTEFGVDDLLRAELSTAQYTYYYRLKSNVTAEGEVTLFFALDLDEERTLEFYYAEDILYMDLSDIGFGTLLTSADWIKDILGGFDLLTDVEALTLNDKIALFAELIGGRSKVDNITTYSLGKECIAMLLAASGYDSIFEYDNLSLSINTANNRLQNVELQIEAFGATLKLSASSPKIGSAVSIAEPAWTQDCVDITITERFTPVFSGTLSSNTLAGDDIALLESFVESLTGESISLEASPRKNIKFSAAANLDETGALKAVKADFYTSSDIYICSFYYTDETPNNFYVIYPLVNGVNPVDTLTIKTTERYSLFMQAINGNAVAEYGDSLFTLSNGDSDWLFGATRGAFDNLLGAVAAVYTGSAFPSIPSDFAMLGIQAEFVAGGIDTRINFAGNTYIDIDFDDISLEFYDVGIAELDVAPRSISIYQNNNMESAASVTFGDGSVAVLSLVSPSGESMWSYSSTPTVGSGVVNVTASVTLLGKQFDKNISVNTSAYIAADTSIGESASPYYDSDEKRFTFARYNCNDNPIDVITAFNRATISTAVSNITNKEVRWLWNGNDIRTGGLDSLNNADFDLVPVVKSFFGTDIGLYSAGVYSVEIVGSKATGISGSNDYLTITAYDGNNPFDESTYAGALAELEDTTTLAINALRFDISSIRADVINNIDFLAEEMYKADGTYLINAVVADCMGCEDIFPVKISVQPRIITSVEFGVYAEGVTFEGQTVDLDRVIGSFTFDPMIVTSLATSSIYARIAKCNGDAFTLNSLKWEFAPVASIDLFNGLEGAMSLVIGTEEGGFQTFEVLYEFPPVDVTSVALADEEGAIIVHNDSEQRIDVKGSDVSFSLLGLDPYNYDYPAKVIFYYDGGEHAFDVDWAFDWDENRLWNRGSDYLYTSAFTDTSLEVNLEISFQARIVETYKFVENPDDSDEIHVKSVTVGESQEDVYLEYKLLDNQKRLIFVSYGPFDPDNELILDYRDIANYPDTVYVQFLNDEEEVWHEMNISWNLDDYDTPNNVMQYGYSGVVGATIGYGQSVGSVYVSVAASVPDETYVVYEGGGATTDKKIRLSILSVDGEELIITDPTDSENFPEQLYLSYEMIPSGWFEVSEWILTDSNGKNVIYEFYKDAIDLGTLLENAATDGIAVKARFGTASTGYIDVSVEAAIAASTMTEKTLSGIPLVSSSITAGGISQNSMVYSVEGDIFRLTVDPYLANPRSSACYPTELSFVLNEDEPWRLSIDSWDLSGVPVTNLHEGDTCSVTALIDVGMEYMIRLPVQLVIKERIIEKIWVDGSTSKTIHIDPYSLQPFGENVEGNYAFKRVDVKFFDDDNTYLMVLKYSIDGISVSYTGGGAAYGVTVQVGNEAGGYQSITGYNIYVKQSLVVSISSEAEVEVSEGVFEPIGEFYRVIDNAGVLEETFDALTEKELAALFNPDEVDELIIQFGTPDDVTATRTVSENNGIIEGLVYEWKRNSLNELYLELWNNNPLYADKLGANQIIESGRTDCVAVTHNLFEPTSILPESGYEELYSGITVGDFLDAHPLESDHFTSEQMEVTLVRASDSHEMDNSDILGAAEYNYVITVTGHPEYGGSLELTINITPIEILETDFEIRLDGEITIDLEYSLVYSGDAVVLNAETVGGIENVLIVVYDGFTGNPKNTGVYNYDVVSSNSNYSCDFSGVLTITKATLNGTNCIIDVGEGYTTAPPVISVRVDGNVLTTSDYSVYYGSEATAESITIENYETFASGYNFNGEDSGTAYVKIVIDMPNYQVAAFVDDFTFSKAQIE